ncbi:hypothetical protein DOY81_009677, partial [Sarcophaga bullata]
TPLNITIPEVSKINLTLASNMASVQSSFAILPTAFTKIFLTLATFSAKVFKTSCTFTPSQPMRQQS